MTNTIYHYEKKNISYLWTGMIYFSDNKNSLVCVCVCACATIGLQLQVYYNDHIQTAM